MRKIAIFLISLNFTLMACQAEAEELIFLAGDKVGNGKQADEKGIPFFCGFSATVKYGTCGCSILWLSPGLDPYVGHSQWNAFSAGECEAPCSSICSQANEGARNGSRAECSPGFKADTGTKTVKIEGCP